MQIDIRSNAREISRWLDDAQRKQVPFATIYAMTLTARDVQAREKSVMERVFDRPTPYALNALQVKPATKQTLTASVEFKDGFGGTPAKRFLNPEVNGGPRSQKSHERQLASKLKGSSYLVPGKGMPLNGWGNVTGGTIKKILSQLGASTDATQNASGSKRSRKKRKAQAYFIPSKGNVVLERKGVMLNVALVGVRAPQYRKRFPFYETAEAVVKERLPINFETALQRAMATSNYKGKWS
jgi:hypothetical protein